MSSRLYPGYQYTQLDTSRKQIRLLSLHPGKPGSPLFCDLQIVDLDQSEPLAFTAISYVWGAGNGPATNIFLGNSEQKSTFPILPNLRSALLRLRKETQYRKLWVDALCINQSNQAEKAQQVPMMGEIYHRSYAVLIWLGEEAEESALALDFIAQITDLSQFDVAVKDRTCTRQWYALAKLMNRSWFQRRWVVQELALSKYALVYCGNGKVDWPSFADAATLFKERHQEISRSFLVSHEYAHDAAIFGEVQALGALRLIEALNRLFRRSEDGKILEGLTTLETLVTSLSCFETKDPRDSIYSVMDLAEDIDHIVPVDNRTNRAEEEKTFPTLRIDYGLPFDEVARGFVASCIKGSSSLDIICRPWAPIPHYYSDDELYSASDGTHNSRQRLSSWACTLSDSIYEIQIGKHARKRGDSFIGPPGRPIYQASKGFPVVTFSELRTELRKDSLQQLPQIKQLENHLEMASFPVDDTWSHKAPRMEVKGIKIGTIASLGERAMEGTIPSEWFSIAKWSQRRAPAPDDFCKTLVADRRSDGSNPPSWYKRALEHALAECRTGDVRLQNMINESERTSSVIKEFLKRVQTVVWNRRFIITDKGSFGLVPAKSERSDVIMVLYGASVPVVIRKLGVSYWIIGECYIHGAMDGLKAKAGSDWSIDRLSKNRGPSMVSADMVEIVSLR